MPVSNPSAAAAGGITWTSVTTATAMVGDNGYIVTGALASERVTMTLPATCAVGKVLYITGVYGCGWKIAQNANQYLMFGNKSTSMGTTGYLKSTNPNDSIQLICTVANTKFTVINAVGIIEVN